MGQAEVVEFLRNHADSWFTSKEIWENINISRAAVVESLRRLKLQDVVEKRRNPDERYGFQYRLLT